MIICLAYFKLVWYVVSKRKYIIVYVAVLIIQRRWHSTEGIQRLSLSIENIFLTVGHVEKI